MMKEYEEALLATLLTYPLPVTFPARNGGHRFLQAEGCFAFLNHLIGSNSQTSPDPLLEFTLP